MGVDEVVLMLSISLSFLGCRLPNSENLTSSVCATVAVASPNHTSTERRRGARGSLLRGASLRS